MCTALSAYSCKDSCGFGKQASRTAFRFFSPSRGTGAIYEASPKRHLTRATISSMSIGQLLFCSICLAPFGNHLGLLGKVLDLDGRIGRKGHPCRSP